MSTAKGPLTPNPAFVVKTFRLDEADAVTDRKVFLNVCCLKGQQGHLHLRIDVYT